MILIQFHALKAKKFVWYVSAHSLLGRVSVLLAAFYMELEETVTPAHAIFKIRELIGNGAFQTMQVNSFRN